MVPEPGMHIVDTAAKPSFLDSIDAVDIGVVIVLVVAAALLVIPGLLRRLRGRRSL